MSVEESPLLKEFKTYLQATLVAFGSEGAVFSLVNQRFSEDWVGSPSLKEYASKLGFCGSKGLIKLLESMPDQVTIVVNPTGEIVLKPVPMEETRDNLAKIDETNKELKAERMRRQQYSGPLSADVIAQLAAGVMPNWPPPVPTHPLASVFNASIGRAPATPLAVGPIPPLSMKKINPNLIPLGPPRFTRCASTSNIAGSANGSSEQNTAPIAPPPKQQPKHSVMTFFGHRKVPPAVVCNDFGDVVPATTASTTSTTSAGEQKQKESPQEPTIVTAEQQQKSCASASSIVGSSNGSSGSNTAPTVSLQNKPKKITFEQAIRYMERETWKQAEKRSDAYYEEDFRASASPRFGSPEPRSPEKIQVDRQPVCEVGKHESPVHEEKENGMKTEELENNSRSAIFEDEEDDFEDTSEDDWDLFDEILEHDAWKEEDDNRECAAFLYQFQHIYNKPVPGGIYRLVHICKRNLGSFSRIDALEKKYFDTYGIRLSSAERNRILGATAATRIAKDSFSKAAYPGLFRVNERKSNYYGIDLLPCLAGEFVDPSMFLSATPLPIRPFTSASTPSRVHLCAYSELLDSLREPPLSPPFTVGQLVLFRHDKLGMCRGKVVRQDSHHLAVKHLDTLNEHYVNMEAIYAFPDQLMGHTITSRPCSQMTETPGRKLKFAVPISEQQFRCY